MNSASPFRRLRSAVVLASLTVAAAGCATAPSVTSPDARFVVGEVLARDDFAGDNSQWRWELDRGGSVTVAGGQLDIDVPGGCTVWFTAPFSGPVLISYDATMIAAGGPNDRVSDLNCFWMARDTRAPDDIFAHRRSGTFSDYDELRCYYVGLGGNSNTTTRFRRYIGQRGNRPLLPGHDLTAPEFLLRPNVTQRIQLVAAGSAIGYYRDGRQIFAYEDPEPYTSGWFALRTLHSHFRVENFRVHRLVARASRP